MKLLKRLVTCFAAVFLLSFPTTAYLYGEERWAVKVAQDQHVKYLFHGYDIRTHRLIAPPGDDNRRTASLGLAVWRPKETTEVG